MTGYQRLSVKPNDFYRKQGITMNVSINMLFDLNDHIYTTWTTYMTVNTAIVGWILTKKGDFKLFHFWCACIAFTIYSVAISNFLLPQYDSRYMVVEELKTQASLELRADKKPGCQKLKDGELNKNGVREYICTFTPPSKNDVCFWLVMVSLLMFMLFFLDYKKQFSTDDGSSG